MGAFHVSAVILPSQEQGAEASNSHYEKSYAKKRIEIIALIAIY